MTGQFIRITLSGSTEEIGLQHSKLLSEQIHQIIEFNKPIFLGNLSDKPAAVMNQKGDLPDQAALFGVLNKTTDCICPCYP